MKHRSEFAAFNVMFFILFGAIAIVFVSIIAYSVTMTVTCYNSGDPNSMACFMISDRHEIGFRNR